MGSPSTRAGAASEPIPTPGVPDPVAIPKPRSGPWTCTTRVAGVAQLRPHGLLGGATGRTRPSRQRGTSHGSRGGALDLPPCAGIYPGVALSTPTPSHAPSPSTAAVLAPAYSTRQGVARPASLRRSAAR